MFNDRWRCFCANRNFARLQRLGHFTDKGDNQKTIGHVGIDHMNVIGQLKPAFKVPGCNAHMQKIAIIIAFALLAASHNQQILLRNYVDLIHLKPGNGDSDLIIILTRALDIERWVIFILRGTARGFEQLEKAVKANGAPAIRCKIKTRHYKFSFKQFGSSPTPQMQRPAFSFWSLSASGWQDGMRPKNCKAKKS
jgi:hypothetical protein